MSVTAAPALRQRKPLKQNRARKGKEIFRVHVNRIAGEVDGVVFTCTIQVLSSTLIEFGFGHADVTSIFVGVIQDGAESWHFDCDVRIIKHHAGQDRTATKANGMDNERTSFGRAPLLLRTRSRGT